MRVVYKSRPELALDEHVVELALVQAARSVLAFDRVAKLDAAGQWPFARIIFPWSCATFGDAVRLPSFTRGYYVELVRRALQGVVDELGAAQRAASRAR